MKNSIGIILLFITALLLSCNNSIGDEHVEKAAEFHEKSDYKSAVNELEEALKKELKAYKKEEVYAMLGNVYGKLDEYDKNIMWQKKALEINPDYADAYVNLGVAYRLLDKYDLAEECYTKALQINPNNPELYTSLGALCIYRGELKSAVLFLKRAIQLDAKQVVAYANLSVAFALAEKYDASEEGYQKAIEMGYDDEDNSLRNRLNEIKQDNQKENKEK